MKFDILKTRHGKLKHKIQNEIDKINPDLGEILSSVDEYEKDNLSTITKLKKNKMLDTKRISGALKQTIHAHGPINALLIGSATKRIYGALLVDEKKTTKKYDYLIFGVGTIMLICWLIFILS
jgi:hypothetical protein